MPGISGSQKAPTYALFNKGRFGATRFGYYSAKTFITVDGVARQADSHVDTLEIQQALDDVPDTAGFRTDGFTPAAGDEVIIRLGSTHNTPLFAGHARLTSATMFQKPATGFITVSAIDYTWLLNRTTVTKRYTNQSATDILTDLIQTYATDFSTAKIASGLATIDEITFTHEELTDALTRVMKRIGGYWYADSSKVIHAFTGTETNVQHPRDLVTPLATLHELQTDADLAPVVNRVSFEGQGTTTLIRRTSGQTTMPIVDDAPFNASGGTVVSGPQRVTYTGLGTFTIPNGTWQLVAATAASYFSVCWSPALNLFCAVGQSGAVSTSPDGLIWTSRTAAEANDWECVCWSPEQALFVAVSLNGTNQVMTSPNGTTWTARAESEANQWIGVCWAPALSIFVAVAATGTHRVMTSPDGITWTNRTAATADSWVRVAWSPSLSLLVAVANTSGTASVMTSPDGITWTSRTHSTFKPWDVVWAETLGLFVVSGDDQFMTSSNGTSWTLSTFTNTARTWNGITYSSELGLLVATARETSITDAVATSPDGVSWSIQSVPSSGGSWQSVTWSPELGCFVAVSGSVGPSFPVLVSVGDAVPQLEGIPASGVGSIQYAINAGDDVNLLVVRNDTASQTALAALIGGGDSGIREEYVQDRRLSETEATDRADAILTEKASTQTTIRFRTRDVNAVVGRTVTIPSPIGVFPAGTFKIQDVTISDFTENGQAYPLRTCVASSRRFSFEDLLRQIQRIT